MKLKYVPPKLIRSMFYDFYWESKVNKVLLTFDDGPVAGNTNIILKKLDDIKAKGLFFCVGNNMEMKSGLVSEILSQGHVIGNHTQNHENVTNMNFNARIEIGEMNERILHDFGVKVEYFRPPHGKFDLSTGKLIRKFGMKNIMWTLLTYDFSGDINQIRKSVSKYLKQNSIVVLHDNLKSKDIIVDSIEYIKEEVHRRGFQFGTPAECLK